MAKDGGFLLIHVDETDGERVRVKMPLAVIDAMLSTDEEELDLVAALEALADYDVGDLVTVDLFDRYEGKGVPEGRVSLAFRLVFQRADRTLTDAEVSKSVDRVVRALTKRFGAELR